MTAVRTMFCWRCNKPVTGIGNCPKCGASLHTLAFMKRLGWIAVVAGAFVVILIVAIGIYIALQSAILCDLATRGKFIGRIYVAFDLIVVCGLLAIVDGIWQLRSGGPIGAQGLDILAVRTGLRRRRRWGRRMRSFVA